MGRCFLYAESTAKRYHHIQFYAHNITENHKLLLRETTGNKIDSLFLYTRVKTEDRFSWIWENIFTRYLIFIVQLQFVNVIKTNLLLYLRDEPENSAEHRTKSTSGMYSYTQYSCTTSKQRLFRAICKSNEGENEVFSSLMRFLTLSTFMWNQTQSQICSRNLLTKSELFQHLLNKAIV